MTYDSPETIIEAVREWQEACEQREVTYINAIGKESHRAYWKAVEREDDALAKLRALRLPPVEEARIEYSGVCHCGEEMEGHSRGNHSPVEMTREARRD